MDIPNHLNQNIPETMTTGAYSNLHVNKWKPQNRFTVKEQLFYNFPPSINPSIDPFDIQPIENNKEIDPDEEDEFGYTIGKLEKKYQHLNHLVLLVTLEKNWYYGLGISLCGHKNKLWRKAVYINDIVPNSPAHLNGQLNIGDQILEVNGYEFENIDFPHAAWTIKLMNTNLFKIVALRNPDVVNNCALREMDYFHKRFQPSIYSKYIRDIITLRVNDGIGISMSHIYDRDVGWIFKILEIHSQSPYENCQLQRGEILVGINGSPVFDATREDVSALIAASPDEVVLTICNLNEGKMNLQREKESGKKNVSRLLQLAAVREEKKLKSIQETSFMEKVANLTENLEETVLLANVKEIDQVETEAGTSTQFSVENSTKVKEDNEDNASALSEPMSIDTDVLNDSELSTSGDTT